MRAIFNDETRDFHTRKHPGTYETQDLTVSISIDIIIIRILETRLNAFSVPLGKIEFSENRPLGPQGYILLPRGILMLGFVIRSV